MNEIKIFLLALPLLLQGCDKEDEKPDLEAHADAYVVKKIFGNEEKTATAFYAFANKELTSVTVTPSSGTGSPFQLKADSLSGFSFYKDPGEEDFLTLWPFETDYQFDIVTSEGLIVQQTDFLEKVELDIPVIISTTYFPIHNAMKVQWDQPSGTDGIVLKLLNRDREVQFISHTLFPATSEAFISEGTGNWLSVIYPGELLILQIQAIAYESNENEADSQYNIATISVSEKSIVWGR